MVEIAFIVALIVGLSQLVKEAGFPKRFIPMVNVLLGVAGGFTIFSSPKEAIIYGLAMGLGASGLFDLSKITSKKK